MAVVIDSGPVSATDSLAQVKPDRWAELVRVRRSFCAVHLSYDCRELLRFVEEAHEMLEPLGYQDVNDFLKRGLELDPLMVQWALNGLRQLKPHEAIPYKRAIELGRPGGDRGNQHTGGKRHSRNTRMASLGESDNRVYVLARLQRDGEANLIARIYAGELSAHAAALQMGYRKQKTALEHLHAWWKKATPTERRAFLRAVQS
jgi:hypothetical protein